jgi:hypothetical protein
MNIHFTKSEQKRIDEISDKVKKNKDQIIFCFREIKVASEFTGGCIPPNSNNYYPYEAGIISDKINFPNCPSYQTIKLPNSLLDTFGMENNYSYAGFLSIPVQSKISGLNSEYNNWFRFDIERLEKLADGQIFTGLGEIFCGELDKHKRLGGSLYDLNKTSIKLENFRLLIGDSEVEEFLIERKTPNWKELIDILKNPEEVERRINKHYDMERKGLAEDFLLRGQELNTYYKKITQIEEEVLNAHLDRKYEQDGSYETWGEKRKAVNDYYDLKGCARILISNLEDLTKKGDEINLKSLPEIRGEIIGFPGGVSPKDYFVWMDKLISHVQEKISCINIHLYEEEKVGSA